MSIISTETILRIKEKWQHAGFQKYLKNTGWMFFSRISTITLSFLVSVYLARNLGVENFGTLNFVISFVTIAGTSLFVIDSLLFKKLNNEPENRDEILGSALLIKFTNSLLTITTASLASLFFANNHETTFLIFVFSLYTIFQPFGIIDSYFQANANIKNITIAGTIAGFISVIIKLAIVYSELGMIYLLASYILDTFAAAMAFTYIYKKYVGSITKWRVNKEIIKYYITKSWPFTVSALATTIYIRADQIFLKVILGSQAVGFYVIAVRFSEVWFFISSAICASLLPAILNSEKTNHELFISRSKKLYSLLFYISIIICVFIFITAPLIISTLYGHEYQPSINLLRIYIWSIIGAFMSAALQQFLLAQSKFKTILSLNIIGMTLSLILNYFFITTWGIKGAAFANIFAYTLPVIIILSLKSMTDQRLSFISAIFKPLS